MALSRGGVQCRECPVFYPSEEEVRLSAMEHPASPGFPVVLRARRRNLSHRVVAGPGDIFALFMF